MSTSKTLEPATQSISASPATTALSLASKDQANTTKAPQSAALLVDGAMLSMYTRERNLQPDLRNLAVWAEEAAGAPLESKQWFDAAPDATWNAFHFAARNAGYVVHVGPVKTRAATLGQFTISHNKQVGVDVALATKGVVSWMNGRWSTVVLVAGDGDFVPLVEQMLEFGVRVILLRDRLSTDQQLEQLASEVHEMSGLIGAITRPRRNDQAA
jgi:uncharacterized LabA/DUF88 family protein